MTQFSVDYHDLESKLNRKRAYRLADVKDRIRKVAFDVVRFVDSDRIDDLWLIHRDGDDEYIVAMYDEDALGKQSDVLGKQKKKASSLWAAVADRAGTNVTVFYNSVPIKRVALSEMGIPAEDAQMVCQWLPEKLATDKAFLRKLAAEVDLDKLTRNVGADIPLEEWLSGSAPEAKLEDEPDCAIFGHEWDRDMETGELKCAYCGGTQSIKSKRL